MSVGDLLSGIGRGVATAGRVAGTVLAPFGKALAEEESGQLPQIEAEKRQQQYKLTDEERERKANDLESQLEMGRKYGTLTPEQQKQYVDQITGLYSKPEQQGSLLQRIHKAIHPTGTVRQAAQPLPSAVPEGGTAAADEAAKERELKARMESQKPSYKAYKLPDESIVNIDVNHEAPPDGAVPVGPEAANQKALNEYRAAQLDLQQKKEELAAAKFAAEQDPNNPATRQRLPRGAGSDDAGAGVCSEGARLLSGNVQRQTSSGALMTETGSPMGASFGGNYFKSSQSLAQLNDAQGSIKATGDTLKALYSSGGSLNDPTVAAALANPQWSAAKLLQGVAAGSLTPEQTDAVIAIKSAQENIQGMRKAAGGGLSNEQVNRLEAQLPGANTPDAAYAEKQLEYLNQTLARLSTGVPRTGGGPQFTGAKPGALLQPHTGAKPIAFGKPIVQFSPSTKQYRYSTDGGKTWQPGQPPSQ